MRLSFRFIRLRLIMGALVCLTVLSAVLYLGAYWVMVVAPFRTYTSQRLAEQLDALSKAGVPATSEEAAQYYALPSGETNGADLYQQAFDAFVRPTHEELSPEEQKLLPLLGAYCPESGEQVPEVNRSLLQAYLLENAPSFGYLDAAVKARYVKFPVPLMESWPSDGNDLRGVSHAMDVLEMRALEESLAGNQVGLENLLRQFLDAGTAVILDPAGTAQLIEGVATIRFAARLKDALHRFALTEETLALLLAELSKFDGRRMLNRVYSADAVMVNLLQVRLQRESRNLFGPSIFTTPDDKFGAFKYNSMMLYADAVGLLDHSHADCIYVLSGLRKLTSYEWTDSLSHWELWEKHHETLDPGSARIMSNLYDALPHYRNAAQRHDALLGVSRVACAVELYHRRHGSLPDSSSALVPLILDNVPVDPYTGDQLRYYRLDDGYTIASTNALLDDGFVAKAESSVTPNEKHDFALTLRRPDFAAK